MLKILAALVFIALILFGGYIAGYAEGEQIATANCPEVETKVEWRELHVPIPCSQQNLTEVCNSKNITVTETKEKIVYKEVSGDKYKAEVYYQIAIKEQDDYYDDIQHSRWDECEAKLEKTYDYLLTSIGFYQLSDQDFTLKIKALENYQIVIGTILEHCKHPDDKTFEEVEDDYEKAYDKYVRYTESLGETPLEIKI